MYGRSSLACVCFITVIGCGGGSDGPSGPAGGGNTVTVGNNFFSPASLSVAPGTTVTWTWADGAVSHNVTFDDGGPNSPTQSSGSFPRTFADPGSYPYHCTIHGAAVMAGTVTVTAAGAGGSGGAGGGGGGYGSP
jgi:plastocyanin